MVLPYIASILLFESWSPRAQVVTYAADTKNVVAVCHGSELLRTLLPHLLEMLELCQKSLSAYLETKCEFPTLHNCIPLFFMKCTAGLKSPMREMGEHVVSCIVVTICPVSIVANTIGGSTKGSGKPPTEDVKPSMRDVFKKWRLCRLPLSI